MEGKLTGQLKGKYAYLQIFSNPFQRTQLLQVSIIGQKFVFTGKVKCAEDEMCTARLFITGKPGFTQKDIVALIKIVKNDMRNIILEEKVLIQIGNSVRDAEVKGGGLNDINNLFQAVDAKKQKEQEALNKWYDEQKKKYSDIKEEFQKINAEFFQSTYKYQDESIKSILKLVTQHPFSKYAMERFMMIAVLNEHSSAKYQQLLQGTWNNLPDETKTSKEGKDIIAKLSKTWHEITLKEGSMIPDYTFRKENRDSVRIQDYRGQYLFIDFWTSWCAPCRAEHYNMKQAYEKFKSNNFSILQVSLDEKKEKWLKAMEDDQLPWINVRNTKGWDKEIESLFNIQGVPTNYLVDPDGKIIARNLRGEDLEKRLSEIFSSKRPF